MHNGKKDSFVLRSAQTPIVRYPIGQQKGFWILMMVLFELHNGKILFGIWGGAPNTHTTAPHKPAKVFLDGWDGGA